MPVAIGDTSTLTFAFTPAGGTPPGDSGGISVTFASDNTSVATVGDTTVDSDGTYSTTVSWVGPGSVNLTALVANTDGTELFDADGTTDFVQPPALAETIEATQASSGTLTLSN